MTLTSLGHTTELPRTLDNVTKCLKTNSTLKSKVATPDVSEANHVEILQDSLTRRRVRAATHAKRRIEPPLRLLVSRPRPITVLLILSLCAGMGQAADWGP